LAAITITARCNDQRTIGKTLSHRDVRSSVSCFSAAILCATLLGAPLLLAQNKVVGPAPSRMQEVVVGPYAAHIAAGGPAILHAVPVSSTMLWSKGVWTLLAWVKIDDGTPATTLVVGVGDPAAEESRFLGFSDRRPIFRMGRGNLIASTTPLTAPGWHLMAATLDGIETKLYVDGVLAAHGQMLLSAVAPELCLAPVVTPLVSAADNDRQQPYELPFEHFGGTLAGVELRPEVLDAATMHELAQRPPDESGTPFEENSPPWSVQLFDQAGYVQPQDPSTIPHSGAPFQKPVAEPTPPLSSSGLSPVGDERWALRTNWYLTPAPQVKADGAALSAKGYDTRGWWRATVPGTVLTTMVDRGVYPAPEFGLNNLAIPESLARQDYWYRTEFTTPASRAGDTYMLTLEGINYAAEVWLNGHLLGEMKGAFRRGRFRVGDLLRPHGENFLAVRVSPPPHPGIPEEESLTSGPGENGGLQALDGPTFVATEGWDWIPAIRDRNTGLWQDVILERTNALQLGDAKVVSHLPLPDISTADIDLTIPVQNLSGTAAIAKVQISFEGASFVRTVNLQPGENTVHLTPQDVPELHLQHPRLWWPNGYGRPDLYHLKLAVAQNGTVSDSRQLTFGVREVTYELSLFDSTGHLRRVEVDPALAAERGEQVVDVRHQAMRNTADLWAASLTLAGEHSPAVREVSNEPGFTDLVLKVNGVRIAARGGNWGMDDLRKRVSREHLEPYFRLEHDAHLNIIRNWVGQNTEEVFYQLADEYGMMVWNDFWDSTEDYNVEAADVPLFLDNARDTVRRFRNHPSIIIWCGRNEGVPQPILNEGLIALLRKEDGTRYYTPSSNRIDLRGSGPYGYQDPAMYYTTLDKGFSVELGTSSLSTRESFEASMDRADVWPISDVWAYHDWHQTWAGDVHPLIDHIDAELGAGTSFDDFERKAQMFNYVNHRAIFEGFNQHLWSPNSGRMLWMTHPSWPSNMWQIYSSDYDTQASYYGVKKACEPLHIQLDLSNDTVSAVNATREDAPGLTAHAVVYSLEGLKLAQHDQPLDLKANGVQPLFPLSLADSYVHGKVALVELELTDSTGQTISRNIYWRAAREEDYRELSSMPQQPLTTSYTRHKDATETTYDVSVTNTGMRPVLELKLTLLNSQSHQRILPAYYSDNYVSLLPGETIHLSVKTPDGVAQNGVFDVRGWNVLEHTVTATGGP
jgi:hypothetical protein